MDKLPTWKRELPATPHKLLDNLVTVLVEFYGEHLRRDRASGRLQPGRAWDLLRGFLIAAMQTYASICMLIAEKRPKRLMLQADVLNRALFEILATVLGILEGSRAARADAPAGITQGPSEKVSVFEFAVGWRSAVGRVS